MGVDGATTLLKQCHCSGCTRALKTCLNPDLKAASAVFMGTPVRAAGVGKTTAPMDFKTGLPLKVRQEHHPRQKG
eukprot:12809901-Alexandrium_andersonii.AAC.1